MSKCYTHVSIITRLCLKKRLHLKSFSNNIDVSQKKFSVNVKIEFSFLDVVDPMNQPAVLTNYHTALKRGIQTIKTAS